MNALNVFLDRVSGKKPKTARKTRPEPDAAYGKPRPMTGFLASLTEEQRKLALTPMDDENLGDPAKVSKP